MSKGVKPLNVSALIKASRYISLICGITYANLRLRALRAYEETARPRRIQKYKELIEQERINTLKDTKEEFRNLTIEINDPEIPLGWEQNIE